MIVLKQDFIQLKFIFTLDENVDYFLLNDLKRKAENLCEAGAMK